MLPARPLKVFLCHASADKPAVRKLYRYLKQRGVQPWLDEIDLLPGQNWQAEIPNALYSSDVILVCLSKNSVNKEGYVQKEISFALDKALEKPEGTIFIIPARLEECSVPSRLSHFQRVDMFREDGYKRLMQSLNLRAASLSPTVAQASVTDESQTIDAVGDGKGQVKLPREVEDDLEDESRHRQNDTVRASSQAFRGGPPLYRSAISRMVEDYEAIFGGRDTELAELDAFLNQETQPFALLLAPTGRGKTALLIHWVTRVQATENWTVIFVPISLRYQTADAGSALGALAHLLAESYGEREKLQTYNTTPDQMRPIIADFLRRSPPDGQRLLLILDGMDEAIGWSVGRDLFPRTPGSHLRIVASAREMAHTTYDDWLDQLGWHSQQTWSMTLPGLNREAAADILRRMAEPLTALATDVDVLTEITRVSEGDPLTIRLLIEALQDGTLSPGNLTRLPPGLEPFVRSWLGELEQHSSQTPAIYLLLGLCAVALGPLTHADLEQLAPEMFQRRVQLRQAASSVARFIIGDGSDHRGYIFSHPRLRELFLEQVLSRDEQDELRQRFVSYGKTWFAKRRVPVSAYLRQFWVSHLAQVGAWDLAREVLTGIVSSGFGYEQPWVTVRYTAEGSYAGYLNDLDILWRHADEQIDLNMGLRCALFASSIQSLSGNLSPELLTGLVEVGTPEGRWSISVALNHIRQMPDAWIQVRAL